MNSPHRVCRSPMCSNPARQQASIPLFPEAEPQGSAPPDTPPKHCVISRSPDGKRGAGQMTYAFFKYLCTDTVVDWQHQVQFLYGDVADHSVPEVQNLIIPFFIGYCRMLQLLVVRSGMLQFCIQLYRIHLLQLLPELLDGIGAVVPVDRAADCRIQQHS